MQYTTLVDAAKKLRHMGAQFLCPKDRFFGPLADEIERLATSQPAPQGAAEIERLREFIRSHAYQREVPTSREPLWAMGGMIGRGKTLWDAIEAAEAAAKPRTKQDVL